MHASNAIVTDATQRLLKNGVTLALLTQKKVTSKTGAGQHITQNAQKPSNKASISISINRGHFHTHGYPHGFAHLLEHMLFNASKHYAEVDALDQHLFDFHGQVNGWTQDLSTHFTLQCEAKGFIKGCKILVDKLANPLFLAEHIDAEITAIDAEFKSKKKQAIRQLLSVQQKTSNPAHPFARFSTGNRLSLLGLDALDAQKNLSPTTAQMKSVQQQLQSYHQLTMQGPHIFICLGLAEGQIEDAEITTLISLIENVFSAKRIAHDGIEQACASTIPIFRPEDLNKYIQIRAPQKEHQLLFSYLLNGIHFDARDSLFIMLSHSIESKHKHGLFDKLQEQQLIQDLQAYYKTIDRQTDELVISLLLTDKGNKNIETVRCIVQEFLHFLQNVGLEDWRYREKEQQYQLQSTLQSPAGLFENCINVSQQLHQKTAITCLQTPEFDIALAKKEMPKVLDKLTRASLRLYLISPQATSSHITEHYQAKYKITALKSIKVDDPYLFAKARQNPFMTTQHPLISGQVGATELQHFCTKGAELKFFQDIRLGKPNGECYMSITDPNMHGSAHQIAIKRVWLACLQQVLSRQFFDVDLASIHFRVYAHQHGISLHTGGLSERQLLLCIELVNVIRAFKADVKTIKEQIKQCIVSLNTIVDQKPFNRLFGYLNEFYQDSNKSNEAVLSALKLLSPKDVTNCQTRYFKDNYVETLLVGNWTLNSAEHFFKRVVKHFPVKNIVSKPASYTQEIFNVKHIHFNKEALEECNLIRHYIPVLNLEEKALAFSHKGFALKLSARCLVLEKLLSGHVFDTLRQKHKMGYMLGVGYKPIGGFPGIAMYISSPTHNESQIFQAMNEAMQNAALQFEKKKGVLQHLVDDLVNQVTPKEPDISQITARMWMHYDDDNPALAYKDLINALCQLTESEISAALQAFMHNQLGQIILTQSRVHNVTLV